MHFRILAASLILTPCSFGLNSTLVSSQLPAYARTPSATTRIQTNIKEYALWVDETKWEQKKSGPLSELQFSHVSGDVWALVETGLFATPTTLLRENVLKTVKSTNPNAKIINEEQRLVNGRQVLAIQFSTSIDGNPIRVLGYYHGGSSGWIQAIAFARDSEFPNKIGEITDFLDGLEILDQDLPSSGQMSYPGFLFVNSRISALRLWSLLWRWR
jgi:hypothetical protein